MERKGGRSIVGGSGVSIVQDWAEGEGDLDVQDEHVPLYISNNFSD